MIDKPTVCNYKHETLLKCLLGVDDESHNALSDVTSLRKLYEEKLAKQCDSSDVFTLSYYIVKASLEPIVQKTVISSLISKRLINCSLRLNKLNLFIKETHSMEYAMSSVSQCLPRISKSKNVINKVVEYMYCVYAMKYNFYYHISCNRIQLTTMFLLLNMMYIYSSLETFARCIKCIIIRQERLCVECKFFSFFILFKEYFVKLFIISSYLKYLYLCVNCPVLAIGSYIFRYIGAHF